MEKLVKLLNEYKTPGKYKEYWYNGKQVKLIKYAEDYAESTSEDITEKIISKKFGFIEWLVENNKIGRNKNSDRSAMLDLMRVEIKEQTDAFECVEKYEWYIMVLSIQNKPINFLISLLK